MDMIERFWCVLVWEWWDVWEPEWLPQWFPNPRARFFVFGARFERVPGEAMQFPKEAPQPPEEA